MIDTLPYPSAGKLPHSRRLDNSAPCPQWRLRSVAHGQRWRAVHALSLLRHHASRVTELSSHRQRGEQAVHRLSLNLRFAYLVPSLAGCLRLPLHPPRIKSARMPVMNRLLFIGFTWHRAARPIFKSGQLAGGCHAASC
jgi:hypothetical protein